MKILYLTPGCFDKGGISRYNRYQIEALRELYGTDKVRVLSLLGPKADDFENPFSVYWFGTGANPISKLAFTWRAFIQAVFWNPDLIIVAHVNFSGIAKLIAMPRNNYTFLNTYGLEVWSGLKKLPAWGLKKMNCVMADCHYTAQFLENEGLRDKGSVAVIWDCVDLTRFYPGAINQSVLSLYKIPNTHDYKLIISLGRISKTAAHKGYDRLLKAFAMIHDRFPNARVVLAGKGDWIDYLKELAASLGITAKVTFTGMVDEEHLVDIYRAAYVFSLASDRGKGRGEGIPLTPLEAMSCGVPVIVGNYDGSQEAVVDEQNGFVIDSLNIQQHADRLAQLLENEKLRNEKGNNAVAVANRYFSYVEFKEKHSALLARLIGSQ